MGFGNQASRFLGFGGTKMRDTFKIDIFFIFASIPVCLPIGEGHRS